MAETSDRLKNLVRMLLECSHDMPYRSGDNIIELNIIWEKHPALRDECKDEWLSAIAWCEQDPYCNDDKYFPEWKAWGQYFSKS